MLEDNEDVKSLEGGVPIELNNENDNPKPLISSSLLKSIDEAYECNAKVRLYVQAVLSSSPS